MMNHTYIDMHVLNVSNCTNSLDFNLGFVLIAYRLAVQYSPNFAFHFMLCCRIIRLLFEVQYRPLEATYKR